MSFSDYLENKILDHLFNDSAFSAPSTYLFLSTTAPNDDGTNVTEPVGNGYARVQISPADMSAASGGSKTNTAVKTFPTATPSGWGTITHWGLYDASTSGNMLTATALSASKTVSAGDTPSFAAGQVVWTLS